MRALFSIVLPLVLPTALYFVYMSLARRRGGASVADVRPTDVPWSWLLVAGGVLVVITYVALYLFEDRGRGAYHPARIIDGQVQPGYFDDKPN
jgi:drug/metabolite transporter (DMT)-like permease